MAHAALKGTPAPSLYDPAMASPGTEPDSAQSIHETLGIRTISSTPEEVVLEMDVGPRVHQPFGLMHGGASAVLAESAASLGAFGNAPEGHQALGIELNVSHLSAVRSGTVRAVATPIRVGRSIQVWRVDLATGEGSPVAAARCTVAIRAPRPDGA